MVYCAVCGELVQITERFMCIEDYIRDKHGTWLAKGSFACTVHIGCFNKKIKKLLKYV